jgi:hypothetical protein
MSAMEAELKVGTSWYRSIPQFSINVTIVAHFSVVAPRSKRHLPEVSVVTPCSKYDLPEVSVVAPRSKRHLPEVSVVTPRSKRHLPEVSSKEKSF